MGYVVVKPCRSPVLVLEKVRLYGYSSELIRERVTIAINHKCIAKRREVAPLVQCSTILMDHQGWNLIIQ
jgi:hypothetical protein